MVRFTCISISSRVGVTALSILFFQLDVKTSNCENPCFKQTQPSVQSAQIIDVSFDRYSCLLSPLLFSIFYRTLLTGFIIISGYLKVNLAVLSYDQS
jgi:hypothetical protein